MAPRIVPGPGSPTRRPAAQGRPPGPERGNYGWRIRDGRCDVTVVGSAVTVTVNAPRLSSTLSSLTPRKSTPAAGMDSGPGWLPIPNAWPLPTRPISAPASWPGSGPPDRRRPIFDPAVTAVSLGSVLSCTSPEALKLTCCPLATVMPVGVQRWLALTVTPPVCPAVVTVVVGAADSTGAAPG